MSTQAQREANLRLQAKKDRIVLWLDKDGTKEQIKEVAAAKGMSVNAYILGLIEEDMKTAGQDQ